MEITVELNIDQVDAIVARELIHLYRTNELFPQESEYHKIRKALRRIIKYTSTLDQWEQFKNETLISETSK
jgi:hypothetical protein